MALRCGRRSLCAVVAAAFTRIAEGGLATIELHDSAGQSPQLLRNERTARAKASAAADAATLPPATVASASASVEVRADGHTVSRDVPALLVEAVDTARLSNITNTSRLVSIENCFDAFDTGIRFRSGEKANCDELKNYCNHNELGEKVKIACAKTCGRCALALQPNAGPMCVDKPRDAIPVFTVQGQVAECSALAVYCTKHVRATDVQTKCPKTCDLCEKATTATTTVPTAKAAPDVEEEAVKGAASTTTKAPSTTTFSFTLSTLQQDDFEVGKDAVSGCSRRRRWGFCYSRRRRWQ